MTLTLTISEDLGAALAGKLPDLEHAALEGLAVAGYESGALSAAQVRVMLGLPGRYETEQFLGKHGVWPGYTLEEILKDTETLAEFRAAHL